MAMFELRVKSNVVDVALSHDNSALAILHQTGIDLYQWQTKGERSIIPKLLSRLEFEASEAGIQSGCVLQISFAGQGELCLLHSNQGQKLSRFLFNADLSESLRFETDVTETVESLRSIVCHGSGGGAYAQANSGRLFRIDSGITESTPVKFPIFLPWVEITTHEEETIAIGLSRNGHLYANSRLLTKNCTSFLLTQDHIILTTNNHLLKFIHLTSIEGKTLSESRSCAFNLTTTELEVPPDDPENDERCRSIERGARLVTAMPTSMNLVLQMPRGNLETIFPRAMVLAGIRQLVDEKNYGKAFAYARTQRVDMNILYDHQPEQFLANVGLFLDQLQDVTYIDLFLSSLR